MYRPIIEIKEYKGYLILKLITKSHNLRTVGVGCMLSNIKTTDIGISEEAYKVLYTHIGNTYANPALEVISPSKMWWASQDGLIIDPSTQVNIFAIPNKTVCDNEIDEKIKTLIDYETKD